MNVSYPLSPCLDLYFNLRSFDAVQGSSSGPDDYLAFGGVHHSVIDYVECTSLRCLIGRGFSAKLGLAMYLVVRSGKDLSNLLMIG